MLELLLLVTFSGLTLASHRRTGLMNPFQIYFLIWFLVFFGYYFSGNSFIEVHSEFLLLMLAAKGIVFLIFIVSFKNISIQVNSSNNFLTEIKNDYYILIAQSLVFFITPYAYIKALSLAGGIDIFSIQGYVQLRYALTEEGEGLGVIGYVAILSYVVSSITSILYLTKQISVFRLIFSVLISLLYVYLGTGRTSVLLLLLLLFVPLVLLGIFKAKGILTFCLVLATFFTFIATMTSKGISVEDGFIENLESFLENLRSYTIAPLLALSKFIEHDFPIALGENTFRIFYSLAYSLGLTITPPVALIRSYEYVPDPTNVYTVYETYFRDFFYVGIFIPPLFLILHWWLYQKAIRVSGVWIFYYAASVYPLAMQFFQDQYFSLLSIWIQVGFWYWFFLRSKRLVFQK